MNDWRGEWKHPFYQYQKDIDKFWTEMMLVWGRPNAIYFSPLSLNTTLHQHYKGNWNASASSFPQMQSCPKTCRSQPSVCTPYFPRLLRLTLDSEDFRRASLWLSPLGNLPPPSLTTDMLITVIYRNYFHLLLSTMKLYNSIHVQLFIPLTWIEHLLPITVLGIEDVSWICMADWFCCILVLIWKQ